MITSYRVIEPNLLIFSSLKELKSSTMFSNRVGIAAALNYKTVLDSFTVSSPERTSSQREVT